MEQPNFNYIKELSQGDVEFEEQLIEVLAKELPSEFSEFQKAFQERNLKLCADWVHKMKHKISILGLVNSYEEADLFENELRDFGETKRYSTFVNTIKQILNFLKGLRQ